MANLNKYKEQFRRLELIHDKYLDFNLSIQDEPSIPLDGSFVDRCLISFMDFSDPDTFLGRYAISSPHYVYEGSVNEGCSLYDIGLTGIDNGLIKYVKYEISNKEFLDILTKSRIDIEKDVYRLFMHPVTGNSLEYSYDYEVVDNKYVSLKGGFYQGFFKLFGFEYQTLPSTIEDEWNIELVIRPMDYETRNNTLNKTHDGNSGIIFYMGTRAENKFAQFYNADFSEYEDRFPDLGDDKFGGYFGEDNDKCEEDNCGEYADDDGYFVEKPVTPECAKEGYYSDGYKFECDTNIYSNDDYYESDEDISDVIINTSEGRSNKLKNYFEIETDNKFITYNWTATGFTTLCDDDYGPILLTGTTNPYNGNMFVDMNRTKTGYTTNNIHELYALYEKEDKYNFTDDLRGNCFAIKCNEDGSIGYRYLIKDCDEPKGFKIQEEKSFPCVIKKQEWNAVNIKIKAVSGYVDKCGSNIDGRKMKIYIYVNGYLKFISKELPMFNFHELNETYEKQEAVPYSISVGGGTQGLCDSIWLDYYRPFNKILDVEKNFAGTFIGDIKTFKFYDCMLEYNEIKNNAITALSQGNEV